MFLVVLGIELRASLLLDRHFTTWAIPSNSFCCSFAQASLGPWSSYLHVLSNWDYRCASPCLAQKLTLFLYQYISFVLWALIPPNGRDNHRECRMPSLLFLHSTSVPETHKMLGLLVDTYLGRHVLRHTGPSGALLETGAPSGSWPQGLFRSAVSFARVGWTDGFWLSQTVAIPYLHTHSCMPFLCDHTLLVHKQPISPEWAQNCMPWIFLGLGFWNSEASVLLTQKLFTCITLCLRQWMLLATKKWSDRKGTLSYHINLCLFHGFLELLW
jgi:hypothetical protein